MDSAVDDRPKLRIGVMGTARIAKRLVAAMQATDGVLVTAIASRTAARASWYAQQYGIQRSFGTYEEILRSEEVDAIYLPLPPALHAPWAEQVALAGKHLLCEKPLAISPTEAGQLDVTFRERGLQWLDATGWLHHERTQVMRKIVDERLGTLKHVSVAVSFFEPFQSVEHRLMPEMGGGCLLDLGWYAIGLGCWAVGGPPRIEAALGEQRQGVWTRVSALLRWPSGTTGMVNCAYDTTSRKWFEVAGEQASLVCDDFTRPWPDKPGSFWVHDRSGGVEREKFTGSQEVRMIAAWRDAIAGTGDLRAYQEQALVTQATLAEWEQVLLSRSA